MIKLRLEEFNVNLVSDISLPDHLVDLRKCRAKDLDEKEQIQLKTSLVKFVCKSLFESLMPYYNNTKGCQSN